MSGRGAARPITAGAPRSVGPWPYVPPLVAAKLGVAALVLSSGFHGISDDDFARIVIAQGFAEAPSLDPSGTSWLPLPFWLYGAAMQLLGPTLALARSIAILLGALAILLVFAAGRALGLRDFAAFTGALIAAVFPYSAYLGVATVPETPAAALTVFGAASLSGGAALRWWGAGALALATAARYEPWAAAFAFAALCAFDAARKREVARLGPGALALAFPALWLLHGVAHHGDALFFVARVSAYQAALGLGPMELGAAIARTPVALVTAEPELVLSAGVAIAARRWLLPRRPDAPNLMRMLVVLGATAVLLVAGDARGSAPTHHGERALLPLWYGAALAIGAAVDSALEATGRARVTLLVTAVVAVLTGAVWVRPAFPRDGFAARTSELALGEVARGLYAERLVIDTPDYGFFAVQAAFGRPSRSRPLHDHDPRKKADQDPLAGDPPALVRTLAQRGERWLVVPTTRAPALGPEATVRDTHGHLALLELESPAAIQRAGSTEVEPAHTGSTQVGR